MGKYIGSRCRMCRREGAKLFLKGTRCSTHRCAMERRAYAPGFHGKTQRVKLSNYGLQLREKQKVKRIYGLYEKQFRNYFAKAVRNKGVTGEILLQFLERRLDSVLLNLGFCSSRRQARQVVGHGVVHVNGRKVNIASFLVKKDDELALKFKKKGQEAIKNNMELTKDRAIPAWLSLDKNQYKAKVIRLPERGDITFPVNEQLIVELYSR
ncbi:MAG: 30S ribosomal protein S4 [Candidatus Omnitrophica bacterium]|nr:30S ribosomal protein S4 [Candidatus Omnitrophota bacterium]